MATLTTPSGSAGATHSFGRRPSRRPCLSRPFWRFPASTPCRPSWRATIRSTSNSNSASPAELAVRYHAADARGQRLLDEAADAIPERPIALLAKAIPSAATLSVAIHLLHALPDSAQDKLREELLDTAETTAADALHRCHRALELDGDTHGYTADEWPPAIYDLTAPLLESSRLDLEPPSLVRQTQDAVRWLSSSIVCLDEDSRETPAALADALARLLAVRVFADTAR